MHIKDHISHWRMPAAYLKVFLQHADSEGVEADSLLEGTGLNTGQLLQSDQSVSFRDIRQVLANFTAKMGAGWHLSLAPRLTIPSHGPLGFAVVTAPDMRASVDVLLRFFGIRGPFLTLAGAVEGDDFVIRLYEAADMGEERIILVELAILSIQGLLERPLGREISGARIRLAHPAPEYRERLEAAFRPQLVYAASGHSIRFPVSWLDEPCALYDEGMHRYLLARCEEDMRAELGALPAEIAVRQALLASPQELPDLKTVAAAQNISTRTLIRRLKKGNTSYGRILEEVRKTLASDYLLHSDVNIASVAYRLGYKDPSNFGRAFRKWFGIPPGRYRSRVDSSR